MTYPHNLPLYCQGKLVDGSRPNFRTLVRYKCVICEKMVVGRVPGPAKILMFCRKCAKEEK